MDTSCEKRLPSRGLGWLWSSTAILPLAVLGCTDERFSLAEATPTVDAGSLPRGLRINEVVSNNEGVWVDEVGETDDYIELVNAGTLTLHLSDYALSDGGAEADLPMVHLAPGQIALLWADGTPDQGQLHLPFRVSAGGETLSLLDHDGGEVDRVRVPALAQHHAYSRVPDGVGSFVDCGYATPARKNGDQCGPPARPDMPEKVTFAPYVWPEVWPPTPGPLVITELALRPAAFVEVLNASEAAIDLGPYSLRVSPHQVGIPWPDATLGTGLEWTVGSLAPGERVAVPVTSDELGALAADPAFEGVVTLWSADSPEPVDRVDFISWPEGKSLARFPDPIGRHRFCDESTPGEANSCTELASRPVGDRLRHLRTPGDLHALGAGRAQLGVESVEFVIDLAAGEVVSMLNSANWDLHYTFVREAIDELPHLNRCDPDEYMQYVQGWIAFSRAHYFETQGTRRYLLGTLVKYGGTGLQTVEFTPGDEISAQQMKQAFFTMMRHVERPSDWFIRPQIEAQIQRLRSIEGQVPIVDPDAPFRGVTYQPLSIAVAFGTLRFVPADQLAAADLGPRDILITDQVPNDIPLIAGLVTEAFQTPLAHVNVLSRGRGTPNMALRAAHEDPAILPWIGQLVRLEVSGSGFSVTPADPAEAVSYWESRQPSGPALVPRLDRGPRGVLPLSQYSLADLPFLGGKAAQMAELGRVSLASIPQNWQNACGLALGPLNIPLKAAAIPLVHSLEHYESSGALARLAELRQDARFAADPQVRAEALAEVRRLVETYPVDPELLASVRGYVAQSWPGQPVRLRSSSNTEDLANFNGAGLYQSTALEPDDPPDALPEAIRTVWASLWNLRAYDEREYYRIDQTQVAMAVLIHPAFHSERANGVTISRNALDPASAAHSYYFNAQIGEALVTNPAPGVTSDEFTYDLERSPNVELFSRSSLTGGARVLADAEMKRIFCNLSAIHQHFRPLLDPEQKNPWFAMDIEWKLLGAERTLLIKQARPYSFGSEPPSGWCEF